MRQRASADGSSSGRSAATRERILTAAEKLFAERGLDKVSLNEVNRAAGQRNTAAVFYHFLNKELLVESILERHQRGIDAQRRGMLDRMDRSGGRPALPELVRVLVVPLVDKLDDASGRAYVRIQAQIEPTKVRPMPATRDLMRRIAGYTEAGSPTAIGRASLFATILLFHALAHRAREEEGGEATPRDEFATALVDAMVAVVQSSVAAPRG